MKSLRTARLTAAQIWKCFPLLLFHGLVSGEREVLASVNTMLDDVDLMMADDNSLKRQIGNWRRIYGMWKSRLYGVRSWANETKRNMQLARAIPMRPGEQVNMAGNANWSVLERDIEKLCVDADLGLKRFESTFGALMATMSIVESQVAIKEAAEVSKLTKLAFFFIPLTLVAGVFGMNLAVSISSHRVSNPPLIRSRVRISIRMVTTN